MSEQRVCRGGTRRVSGDSDRPDATAGRAARRAAGSAAREPRALEPAGAATPRARRPRGPIFPLRRRAGQDGGRGWGRRWRPPRLRPHVTDATRRETWECEHAPPRYSVVCDAAHRARAKWTARGVRFENVSWRAREPVETVDPRFFCETASPYDFVFSRHTMLLVPCFSFQPPKKKNENEFAIRAAALAARRSGARLAPVSPPAALPTILTEHTRKTKKPQKLRIIPRGSCANSASRPYSAGDMHSSAAPWRARARAAPPAPAPPGAGRGRGHGRRTRSGPLGGPPGARGNFGIGLGDGVRRGPFSGSGAALLQRARFCAALFSCVFLRAAARGVAGVDAGRDARLFFFFFSSAGFGSFGFISRTFAGSGEVVHETGARRDRASPAATDDAPLQSRVTPRSEEKRRAAARLRAPSETIPRFVVCASSLFPPIVSASAFRTSAFKARSIGGRGSAARLGGARARRRCSPFFSLGFSFVVVPTGVGSSMRHSAWGTSASTFTKPLSASSTRGGAFRLGGGVVAESVSVLMRHDAARHLQSSRDVLGEASPTRGSPRTSVGGLRAARVGGARAPD